MTAHKHDAEQAIAVAIRTTLQRREENVLPAMVQCCVQDQLWIKPPMMIVAGLPEQISGSAGANFQLDEVE